MRCRSDDLFGRITIGLLRVGDTNKVQLIGFGYEWNSNPLPWEEPAGAPLRFTVGSLA